MLYVPRALAAEVVTVDGSDPSAHTNGLDPRWTNRVTGQKLNTRGLLGLFDNGGDGVKIAESSSESNAKACHKAISKLRKSKARKKRSDYETEDEPESDGMDLGPSSHTVSMGNSDFLAFDDGDDDDTDILGTVGLNSCTGVLIVGDKGAVIAHLDPIEDGEGTDRFKQDVEGKVKAVYNDNKDKMENAKM